MDSDTTAGDGRRNPLGHVSLAVGAVAVLLGVVLTLSQTGIVRSGDYALLGVLGLVRSAVDVLLGAAAALLGVVALLSRRASRPLAAAGIAVGAVVLVSAVTSMLYGLLLQTVA